MQQLTTRTKKHNTRGLRARTARTRRMAHDEMRAAEFLFCNSTTYSTVATVYSTGSMLCWREKVEERARVGRRRSVVMGADY
mmetsp:Transcript_34924/g.76591  ORF Transcript_34924/g.76591 Transcript_34924/m.76591 type:complete len:82 (+) Transcript_34924:452-697(+)